MAGADALFRQFCSGGLDLLNRVVAEEWSEDPLLDFKTLENHGAPITKRDRRNLAEALSGFANSDGGVIVWGVDARAPRRDEPDVARTLCPVSNLKLFCSELRRDTAHVVAPAVGGVRHEPILQSKDADEGFVVSLVPRSESEPHMARASDQHRFYYRSGSSFLPMESFMIADRYSRRPQPQLDLECRLEQGGSTPHELTVRVVIGIRNRGRGIALYPAVAIFETGDVVLDTYGLDGNGRTGLPERARSPRGADEGRRVFAGGADYVIHPGTALDVTCASRHVKVEQEPPEDMTFTYELYCEGQSQQGEVTVPLRDFVTKWRGP